MLGEVAPLSQVGRRWAGGGRLGGRRGTKDGVRAGFRGRR